MQLTPAQLQTLKAWVVANANSVYEQSTVDLLNATASPEYRVLREAVPVREIIANGFDWTRVDNASVGQARIFEWMCSVFSVDAGNGRSLTNIDEQVLRGIGEAWKGNTPAAQMDHRRAILAHMHRPARVWEKLYVRAAGNWNVATNGDQSGNPGSTMNPALLGIGSDGGLLEGEITLDNLIAAANS